MPKRFTDTVKWDKQWYQELPPRLKCFWHYICDKCDQAGIWEENYVLASFQIGEPVKRSDLNKFGHRITRLSETRILITGFIDFQCGKLSRECKAHAPIFTILERNGIEVTLDATTHRVLIGYPKGIHTLQEKDKEKEREEGTEKEGPALFETENSQPPPSRSPVQIPPNLDTPTFNPVWGRWVKFRKGRGRCSDFDALFCEQLNWLHGFGVDRATRIVEQSLRNGWQGLFDKGTESEINKHTDKPNPRNAGCITTEGNAERIAAKVRAMQATQAALPDPLAEQVAAS